MSSDALPITPSAFAAALESLPLSTLHVKAAELRNSLTHLEYSNTQLEPFAHPPSGGEPDPVCIEAIDENIVVMSQMRERLGLLKEEAEKRGVGFGELIGQEGIEPIARGASDAVTVNEIADRIPAEVATATSVQELATQEEQPVQRHSAWTDGTFQMGRISNGTMIMDDNSNSVQGARQGAASGVNDTLTNGVNTSSTAQGGRLSDEELRRRMEERLSAEDDGSMHL